MALGGTIPSCSLAVHLTCRRALDMRKRTVHPRRQASSNERGKNTPWIYRVNIEPDDGRYYAEVPKLPGCYSWGHTYEEALKNLKEALVLWLEVKKEAGEPIPVEDPRAVKGAPITIGVLV